MTQGIIGKKVGMSQIFRDDGKVQAVTAIEAGPCTVTQVKTIAKDGYNAVQLGFGKAKRPKRGHPKETEQFKYQREFRLDDNETAEVGQNIVPKLDKILMSACSRSATWLRLPGYQRAKVLPE